MKYFFSIVGVLALLSSLASCAMSKSAVQETSGAVIGVIGILALGIGAVLDEMQRSRKEVASQFRYLGEFLKERLR